MAQHRFQPAWKNRHKTRDAATSEAYALRRLREAEQLHDATMAQHGNKKRSSPRVGWPGPSPEQELRQKLRKAARTSRPVTLPKVMS